MQIQQRLKRAGLPALVAGFIVIAAGTAIAATTTYDFSSLAAGTNYLWGDVINTPTATLEMKKFQYANGTWTDAGVATVVSSTMANGSATKELDVDSIMVQVDPSSAATSATFLYADLGGQINLGVNGVHANEPDFDDLDGDSIGNCTITVTETAFAGGVRGRVTITPDAGYSIDKFGFGGVNLHVDDVSFDY